MPVRVPNKKNAVRDFEVFKLKFLLLIMKFLKTPKAYPLVVVLY